MNEPVILIGGSVRAAAFSALRAGFVPWCLDLFADADLQAVAQAQRCPFDDYPQRLPELLRQAPPGPVVYTGGLENHPQLIERIAAERPLWGNGPAALRKARDPFFIARLLRENALKCPMVARSAREGKNQALAHASAYLKKPLKGAGGTGIDFAASTDSPHGYYFQQFIPGPSYSAVHCAFADHTELLGITEQLVGEPWLYAKPFNYCGSIGPAVLEPQVEKKVARLGEVLRVGCGLRSLFGVDFILHDGEPWPVEVNPRYTASIEVLELTTGMKALERHAVAFCPSRERERPGCLTPVAHAPGSPKHDFIAKAILFAPRRFTYTALAIDDIADVPHSGDIIEQGWPILTILARGSSVEDCRENLKQQAAQAYHLLAID
jgi:predicted ATP-grasp superfamily ATP-dependent carboligase